MKIAISADSTSSISRKEAEKLNISILPLNVIVDTKEYHDGVSINQKTLNQMMRGGAKIQTSTPTPYEIETFFDNIFKQGYDKVIHFTISSKLSSMYDLFLVTCKEKYGDNVIVIDSLSVCTFMGNLVKEAKKLTDNQVDINEIIEIIKRNINQEEVYFIPESLTFLKNGGRVSPAVAAIGNLMGIKPILKFSNGEIYKYSKTRTVKKGYLNILNELANKNYEPSDYEIHLIQFDSKSIVDEVEKDAKEILPGFDIVRGDIAINVCAHAGPGTIGIGITKKIK